MKTPMEIIITKNSDEHYDYKVLVNGSTWTSSLGILNGTAEIALQRAIETVSDYRIAEELRLNGGVEIKLTDKTNE